MATMIDPKLTERIAQAIADVRAGKMVILVDDEDRENEGDLTMAAQFVTPDAINFMATHGRGLICLTLTEEHIARLALPMMAAPGTAARTPFTTRTIGSMHQRWNSAGGSVPAHVSKICTASTPAWN